MWFSSLGSGNWHYSTLCVPGSVTTNPSLFFSCFLMISSQVWSNQYSAKHTRRPLWRSLLSSFLSAKQPYLSRPQLCFFNSRRLPVIILFPLPALWSENPTNSFSWGNHWSHHICLISLRNHWPSLPDIQFLEKLLHTSYPVFFLCSFSLSLSLSLPLLPFFNVLNRRVNQVLITYSSIPS